MLIRLIPDSPHPSVLFALTFANTPFAYSTERTHNIPHASIHNEAAHGTPICISPGWTNQLAALANDDLDAPTALHALDRAAGIPTLLQEVTLDIPSCTIRCLFIDGSVEEWAWPPPSPCNAQNPGVPADKRPRALGGAAAMRHYLDMLEGVIKDVAQSTIEEDRERQKELFALQQQQQEQQRRRNECTFTHPSIPRANIKSHKKQRSFFMNFVASIVNLSPASSANLHPRLPPPLSPVSPIPPKLSPHSVPLPLTPTPPPTPTFIRSPFPPLWSPPSRTLKQTLRSIEPPINASRALRWHARSALVDTFRRFVLPEIAVRCSYGSYRNSHAINMTSCHPDNLGKVGGGYYVWILESVLRRAGERMDELVSMAAAAGMEASDRDRERRIKSKIFPRFSVQRRKSHGANTSVNQAPVPVHSRRVSGEDMVEKERERREAEYFASTTQSVHPPSLFSDEEEDHMEEGRRRRSIHMPGSHNDCDAVIVEDDETDTIETDTDGSSVHTPSSGHESFTFPLPSSKPAVPPKCPTTPLGYKTTALPNVPTMRLVSPSPVPARSSLSSAMTDCPPPGSLPPTEMAEYKSLSRLTGKLQHLLLVARARVAHAENEARQREALLELRSRRRAWLNRALKINVRKPGIPGGVSYGYHSTCSMSAPFKSSQLARWTWTSEDWEYVPPGSELEDDDDIILQERTRFSVGDEIDGFGYKLKKPNSRVQAKLFPVSEEEEDEAEQHRRGDEEALMGMGIGDGEDGMCEDLRELELGMDGFGLDLESGEVGWGDDEDIGGHRGEHRLTSIVAGPGVRIAFEVERPKVRVRTSSMYEQKTPFERPLLVQQSLEKKSDQSSILPDQSIPAQQSGLQPSSLLCQPLRTGSSAGEASEKDGDSQSLRGAIFTPPVGKESGNPVVESAVSPLSTVEETSLLAEEMEELTLSMDLPPHARLRADASLAASPLSSATNPTVSKEALYAASVLDV
ncbi:hypothetical protein AMATHDRAFT_47342 [Amanita thiersii Skay4041]|uniref:Uncharacterized protein n=1 Tax=Amanita thiersii Skay4041 TaxID=703135 RepID=A0A2A9NSE6_9AGAR|nr:hypothetical protein AMATHDRAFT_47342 [Amanita thiersii Skay4041]